MMQLSLIKHKFIEDQSEVVIITIYELPYAKPITFIFPLTRHISSLQNGRNDSGALLWLLLLKHMHTQHGLQEQKDRKLKDHPL